MFLFIPENTYTTLFKIATINLVYLCTDGDQPLQIVLHGLVFFGIPASHTNNVKKTKAEASTIL